MGFLKMNTKPDYTKQCSRCPIVVRMSREQYEKEKDQLETTCDRCRAILTAEAAEVLKNAAAAADPLPKDEAQQPQAPAAPAPTT